MFDATPEAFEAQQQIDTATTKEMGADRSEFIRQLTAMSPNGVTVGENQAQMPLGNGTVTFDIAEKPARRLGMLTLPVTAITIRFESVGRAAAETFMRQFQQSFLRMGG